MPKRRRKRAASARIKILIASIAIALVPTVGVSWALIHSAINSEKDSIVNQYQSDVLILADKLSSEDYFDTYREDKKIELFDQYASIWGGRIQVIDHAGKIILDSCEIDEGAYNVSDCVLMALNNQTYESIDDETNIITIAQPVLSTDETEYEVPLEDLGKGEEPTYRQKVDGVLVLSVDVSQRLSGLMIVNNSMYLVWIAAAFVIGLIVWIVTLYIFKPFKKIVDDIHGATDGVVSKVDVHTVRETSEISDAVNYSINRMKTLDSSKQEFISNVSHELKTPITSMRIIADSINQMDVVPNEMYEEFMRDISVELNREGQIIDDLLQISKLEEGAIMINPEETNLNEWLEEILTRIKPVALEAGVELLLESFRPVVAEIDASKLMITVKNLVENAIKYNSDNGMVKVSLNADHHYFFIKVEDSGIGIPEEDIPYVFDRFFRVEKDRSRDTGGTGLGLAISKQIVLLHHGMIKVSSRIDEGTTFVIRIPLKYKAGEEACDD